MRNIRTMACERARVWAALLPDGELSQFEKRILEVHLARCADCARHAEQVAAIVAVVRETPSESMQSSVEVVRRPRLGWGSMRRLAVGGTAAAAAAAIALSIAVAVDRAPQPTVPSPPVIVVGSPQSVNDDAVRWRETQEAKRAEVARQRSFRVPGPLLS
jgi:anti-sigma factor RsiW